MNELSERARELMQRLDALSSRKQQESLIEQALLAERRLAMEEAAKIAEYPGTRCACQTAPDHISPTCYTVKLCEISDQTAAKLRAAAEKEVQK